jgi:hypothetical protein
MTIVRHFITILIGAAVLAGLLFAFNSLPGMGLLPYYILLAFFWGFWLIPVALIMVIVHVIRKWRTGEGGSSMKFVRGYIAAMLGLALFLGIWGPLQGPHKYRQVGGKSPYLLTADVMAGRGKVSLGVRAAEDPGVTQGTLVTASAREIASEIGSLNVRKSYSLRIIAASPDVVWTVKPGDGVQIEGDATIAPGTYRDFTVTAGGETATLTSFGTGDCSLDRDPNECRK